MVIHDVYIDTKVDVMDGCRRRYDVHSGISSSRSGAQELVEGGPHVLLDVVRFQSSKHSDALSGRIVITGIPAQPLLVRVGRGLAGKRVHGRVDIEGMDLLGS